eukprot:gene8019-9421_t
MSAAINIDQALLSHHLTPVEVPVYRLNADAAFATLSEKEKLYAHYYSRASWEGSIICLGQTSVESPAIFNLFQLMFSIQTPAALRSSVVPSVVTDEEYTALLQYTANFYGNMGNYLSFGDSKFIPRIPRDKLAQIVQSFKNDTITQLWNQCGELMYALGPRERELGFAPTNVTTYYSPDVTKDEIDTVQRFMDSKNISPYNTRIIKYVTPNDSGKDDVVLKLMMASVVSSSDAAIQFENVTIQIVYGDWSQHLAAVNDNLKQAIASAANDNQVKMTEKYIDSFAKGSIEDHKESQRYWIKDVQPAVETNIGFIESYRDPYGVRGEFEGFVSIVNKEMSKKLAELINQAHRFIPLLPWPATFEKDGFKKPDFTSLDVLTFASTGVPAGINIPNYDDIRQNDGHKNVSLGNVIAARKQEHVTFIEDKDQDMFNKLMADAFEVQVAIHESLGHGTGKLFMRDENGKVNYDEATTVNPLTNGPIGKNEVYLPGETYDGKFKSLGSAFEECRAECVGIFLSVNRDILGFFGYENQQALDIFYTNWLIMARAGVCALEFYTVDPSKWRQAHSQARYAILQVLLRAGQGLLTIDTTTVKDDILIKLDRTKIESVGVPAIGKFLQQLMVIKSTGNAEAATKLFADYTAVPEEFVKIRETVLKHKKPRKVFVQSNTVVQDGKVVLQNYADTPEGVIESFVARFPVSKC